MKNKKSQMVDFFIIIVIFLVFCLLIIGTLYISKIFNNDIQEANCKKMSDNGHITHIEHLKIFGMTYKDCYIQINDSKSIPYDRYIGIEK